jgi:hypothetical protein
MKRNVLAIAIWDLVLVGVPLASGAILALNNWPFGNIRILFANVRVLGSTRLQLFQRSLCW